MNPSPLDEVLDPPHRSTPQRRREKRCPETVELPAELERVVEDLIVADKLGLADNTQAAAHVHAGRFA